MYVAPSLSFVLNSLVRLTVFLSYDLLTGCGNPSQDLHDHVRLLVPRALRAMLASVR